MISEGEYKEKLISDIRIVYSSFKDVFEGGMSDLYFSITCIVYIIFLYRLLLYEPASAGLNIISLFIMLAFLGCVFIIAAIGGFLVFLLLFCFVKIPLSVEVCYDFFENREQIKEETVSFSSKSFVPLMAVFDMILVVLSSASVTLHFYETTGRFIVAMSFWMLTFLSIKKTFSGRKKCFHAQSLYEELEPELKKLTKTLMSDIRIYRRAVKDVNGKIYYISDNRLVSVDQNGNIETVNIPAAFDSKLYFKKSPDHDYITAKDLYNDLDISLKLFLGEKVS